jgi:hypothetical protein
MLNPFLMPKLRSNFFVNVTNIDGSIEQEFSILEQQLVSIDLGAEILMNDGLKNHKTNRVVMWLEDDVECKLMKLIRRMQRDRLSVDITVTLTNGVKPLEKYFFKTATPEALQHSMLSYSPVDDRLDLTVKNDALNPVKIVGSLYSSQTKMTNMKLLQFFFLEFEHSFCDEQDQ